ncbi:MAG: hypothetical protein ACXAE3_09825 [Candidatus Kariarchaeaceae archaeon]
MEEELRTLLSRFAFKTGDVPQLFLSYQQLKSNPHEYFDSLTDGQLILSPGDFVSQLPIEKKEWYRLSTFSYMLGTNYRLDQIILEHDRMGLADVVQLWMSQMRSTFLPELGELRSEAELLPKMRAVCYYFVKVKMIALIEDESSFFTEFMELGNPQLLVHFAQRLQSTKSQLQLQKYIVRRIFSKLPKEFDYVDVLTFVEYFSQYGDLLQPDQVMGIISQIEHLRLGFRKKQLAFSRCISVLEEHSPSEIIRQAWEYPRLQVRNLFLPSFFAVASNSQIRMYYDEHPSETSRLQLLRVLLGKTTDPFFLNLLMEEHPHERRVVLTSLTIYPIEDIPEVIDFLKSLPDRYEPQEVEGMFNTYWSRDFLLYHQILQRLDEMSPEPVSNVVRAKFRISGILTG